MAALRLESLERRRRETCVPRFAFSGARMRPAPPTTTAGSGWHLRLPGELVEGVARNGGLVAPDQEHAPLMMVRPEAQQKIVDEPLVHADEPGIWLAAQNSPVPHAGGADAEHAPLTMICPDRQQKIVDE